MTRNLKITNSLTRQKELFKPINPRAVTMYACGPTVYDSPHVGNARTLIVFDTLYRVLKKIYENVSYVRNITDVDDKIIEASKNKKESLISNGTTIPVNVTAQDLLLVRDESGIDTFSLIATLERALLANDGIAIANRLDDLELAQNQVLKQQADVGNTIRELYAIQSKLENLQFNKEKQLSDVQDLDIAEATVDLKVAEANNKLSLNTGARLIQPTLSDFLR